MSEHEVNIPIKMEDSDKRVLLSSWPEDFGELYDIALKTYKKVFENEKWRKTYPYKLDNLEPQQWHTDEGFRRQALSIIQVFSKAVVSLAMAGDDNAENKLSLDKYLINLGHLHQKGVDGFQQDWLKPFIDQFILITMQSKTAQRLPENDQQAARAVWERVSLYMSECMKQGAINGVPDAAGTEAPNTNQLQTHPVGHKASISVRKFSRLTAAAMGIPLNQPEPDQPRKQSQTNKHKRSN